MQYVRNNASWYKCQLVSDAHFLNQYIALLTSLAAAPSESVIFPSLIHKHTLFKGLGSD